MSSLRERIQAAKADKPLLLVPKIKAWMIANANNRSWSDEGLELAMRLLRRQDAKGDTMAEHRFSPSSATYDHCDRRAVISYMGYPSDPIDDPETLNRFWAGDMTHLKWQVNLFEMGFAEAHHLEMPVAVPEYGAQGTCDGVLSVPLSGWSPEMTREQTRALVAHLQDMDPTQIWSPLLEIKDMNEYRYRACVARGGTEEKILWQGAIYKEGAERLLGFELDGVCFFHENKANNSFTEYDWTPSERLAEEMRLKYRDWLRLTSSNELPPRMFTDSDKPCRFCSVHSHCVRLDQKGKTSIKPFATGRLK